MYVSKFINELITAKVGKEGNIVTLTSNVENVQIIDTNVHARQFVNNIQVYSGVASHPDCGVAERF